MVKKSTKREKRREIVQGHLEENGCIRCGETDPRVLDFHHRDPSQKVMGVSRMVYVAVTEEMLLEEIQKCDVLCANCHRIVHAEERGEYR